MEAQRFLFGRPAVRMDPFNSGNLLGVKLPQQRCFLFFFSRRCWKLQYSQEEAGVLGGRKCSYECRDGRSLEPPAPRPDSISSLGFGSERLFLSGLHSLSRVRFITSTCYCLNTRF